MALAARNPLRASPSLTPLVEPVAAIGELDEALGSIETETPAGRG